MSSEDQAGSDPEEEVVATATISDREPAPNLEQFEEKQKLANRKASQELGFGKVYAYGALMAMSTQVAIADTAFYIYGYENGWHIPANAIEVWLAATVIQVIGVVLVIARSLFPARRSSQ